MEKIILPKFRSAEGFKKPDALANGLTTAGRCPGSPPNSGSRESRFASC